MAAHDYEFITRWRVQGTCEEVSELLADGEGLPRWWPSVYHEVRELTPGDARGVGRSFELSTQGWLPYRLRWTLLTTEMRSPHGFSLTAQGDFVGTGDWRFAQEGEWVDITYTWRIRAEKPLLRHLSFLLKPVFSANHEWAMARGLTSLERELRRRHAPTAEARSAVPPPPGPVSALRATLVLLLGAAGIAALLGYLLH